MKFKLEPVLHYVLAFLLVGTLALILMDFVVMPIYVKHGQKIALPDVRGMKYDAAQQLLHSKGFEPVKSDMKYNPDFEPGTVIDQQPPANSTVKSGRRVYLTMAIAEKFIPMPNVVGKTVRGARLELNREGLNIDTLLHNYSDKFPEDVVIWQSVKSKSLIRRGSSVKLQVSMGKNPNVFIVPDVKNLSLKDGKQRLEDAGLSVGNIRYVQDPDLIPYTILEQSDAPGTRLNQPQKVDLVVSVLNLNDIYNEEMRQN